jgi:hypothetical protein
MSEDLEEQLWNIFATTAKYRSQGGKETTESSNTVHLIVRHWLEGVLPIQKLQKQRLPSL